MSQATDLELWNAAAGAYEETFVTNRDWRKREILGPALFDLLGDVAGQELLDAGCGQGWLSRELAGRGARVVGVDGSTEMLARARRQTAEGGPSFLQADLCASLPLASASFDTVVSSMVLMDIPEIATAIGEFRRVLRPTGGLLIAITHPSFFPWAWTRGASGEKLYKPVDEYLDEWSCLNQFWGPTRHYHRPLSHYVGALTSSGSLLDALVEPVPVTPRGPEREHVWRIPDFVLLRARVSPG